MDSKIITNAAKEVITCISFTLWCIPYSLIITIQDFYSCFRNVFHLLFHHLGLDSSQQSSPVSINNNISSISSRDIDEKARPVVKISSHDVEVVMKQLRLPHHEPFDSVENIGDMFDRVEPSLDEVREAFRMFDKNNDGFVDAEELEKMMSSLGVVGLSEQECERMIMVFDDDGDGRISFGEFVKLIEENVCC